MQPPVVTFKGVIKLTNTVDFACGEIESLEELLKLLPNYLSVELPGVNSVIVGFDSPGSDDTNKVWFRTDLSGNVLGIYMFQKGAWRPIPPHPTGQVFWMAIDSRSPPDGFQLITASGPSTIPSSVRNQLMTQYVDDSTNTYYLYAAYAFIGYSAV